MNQEITNLLKAYENALNTSDTDAALELYGSDPVFMAEFADAFAGREAVRAAYVRVFNTIKLDVRFRIHEIVDIGGDLAYGRTTSAGRQEALPVHSLASSWRSCGFAWVTTIPRITGWPSVMRFPWFPGNLASSDNSSRCMTVSIRRR